MQSQCNHEKVIELLKLKGIYKNTCQVFFNSVKVMKDKEIPIKTLQTFTDLRRIGDMMTKCNIVF